jgi:aminomethyltransferase
MLNESGGVLDDLIVYYLSDSWFRVVVNAGTRDKDLAWIRRHAREFDVGVLERTELAMLAIQGPEGRAKTAKLLSRVGAATALELDTFVGREIDGWFVARTGYTGEDGFEISVHESQAEALARAILAQPEVKPIGLGARNSLRLEAGLCLYGNDIDTTTTPVEAQLNWAMQKIRRTGGARAGGFPGADKVLGQLDGAVPLERKRVGLVALERIPVRDHTELQDANGKRIGEVTSGLLGPTIDKPIAMGYVDSSCAAVGTRAYAMVRGKAVPMEVAAMPFVPNRYYRGQQ